MNDEMRETTGPLAGRESNGRFAPGISGNPAGRRKGSRHKLAESLLTALAEHFAEHGKEAIERVYAEKPEAYLAIMVRCVPREFELSVNDESPLADVPPDVLAEFLRMLQAARLKVEARGAPAPEPAWHDMSGEVERRRGH